MPAALSSGLTGMSIRTGVALALSLFFCIFPFGQPTVHSPAGMFLECLVGVVLSLPIVLLCSCDGSSGELMDAIRGQTIGTIYDASNTAPLSITSECFSSFGWIVVLFLGGFEEIHTTAGPKALK